MAKGEVENMQFLSGSSVRNAGPYTLKRKKGMNLPKFMTPRGDLRGPSDIERFGNMRLSSRTGRVTRGQVLVGAAAIAGLAIGGAILYSRMRSKKKVGDYKVELHNNLRGQSDLYITGKDINVHKQMPTKEAVPLYASIKTVTDAKQIGLA